MPEVPEGGDVKKTLYVCDALRRLNGGVLLPETEPTVVAIRKVAVALVAVSGVEHDLLVPAANTVRLVMLVPTGGEPVVVSDWPVPVPSRPTTAWDVVRLVTAAEVTAQRLGDYHKWRTGGDVPLGLEVG